MNQIDTRYPGPETIHRFTLGNGLILLVYENFASESIVLEGVIPGAGALSEPSDKAGLADFTTDLLMRGTQKRDFAQIYEELESVGGSLGIGSGRHVAQFWANSLVEDLDLMLDLLSQALRYPLFPAEQVQQVRGQILTGLQMRANNTQQMANLTFMETLYAGHPYGRSLNGYPETITAISQAELVDFHKRFYGPQDMILVLVGAIKAQEALAKVTAVFGDWVNMGAQGVTAVANMTRPAGLVRRFLPMPDKMQSDIVLGLPGPLCSAPDYLHASVMNTVLGVFGMMGRIGRVVREEQGLAYYAGSHLAGGLGPTPWSATAGVAPDDVEQAITAVLQEIERIRREPVPADELADTIAYRTGSLPVGLETNAGLADIIADMELFGIGLDYLQRFPALVRAITPEHIQAAAQKYLSSEQLVIAVAGADR